MHSSFYAFALRKQVRDGELVGKSAPIDAPSVAELRAAGVEQRSAPALEHDLLEKLSGLFESNRALRSSRQTGPRTRSK